MKRFADLSEQEVPALAISNVDEDNLIYRSFADGLRSSYPDTAGMFDKMAEEEIEHRGLLLDLYRKKFGDFLPLIRRQDVKGFVARRPIWLNRPLAIDATCKFAEEMEYETARFYRRAAQSARDDDVRNLLNKVAVAEDKHEKLAHELGEKITPSARATEDQTARRVFMLQMCSRGSPASWTAPSPRSHRSLRRPSPRTIRGRHSWSGSRRRSAPASPRPSLRLSR
jgi:rubrerythrin